KFSILTVNLRASLFRPNPGPGDRVLSDSRESGPNAVASKAGTADRERIALATKSQLTYSALSERETDADLLPFGRPMCRAQGLPPEPGPGWHDSLHPRAFDCPGAEATPARTRLVRRSANQGVGL